MTISRRTLLGSGLALSTVGAATVPASAQAYPTKPIRWIAPFAAGGNYDLTSRLVGEGMSRTLGQTVIVDNRPGAGGLVGAEAAANAPADGYTVVMGSFSVLFVSPYLAGKPSLVPMFAPISLLSTVPMILVGKPDGRFADIRAALAEAKAKPGTVSIGHAGNGTTNHIAILRLEVNEGVKFNIIPYKGSGPGLADLMSGQIDLYMDQLTTSLPHIKSGKLKGLLAMSSRPRLAASRHAVAHRHRQQAVRRWYDGWRTGARRDAEADPHHPERRRRGRTEGSRHRCEARRARRRAASLDHGGVRSLHEGSGSGC